MDRHLSKCLFNVGLTSQGGVRVSVGSDMSLEGVDVWLDIGSTERTAQPTPRGFLTRSVAQVVDIALLKLCHGCQQSMCRARTCRPDEELTENARWASSGPMRAWPCVVKRSLMSVGEERVHGGESAGALSGAKSMRLSEVSTARPGLVRPSL